MSITVLLFFLPLASVFQIKNKGKLNGLCSDLNLSRARECILSNISSISWQGLFLREYILGLMADNFAFYPGLNSSFIQQSSNIWTKFLDFQIEGYLATSWTSSVTAFLSLYTLTLLSNLFFINELIGIGMQEGLCLKNSAVWGGMFAKVNADLALGRKQLL